MGDRIGCNAGDKDYCGCPDALRENLEIRARQDDEIERLRTVLQSITNMKNYSTPQAEAIDRARALAGTDPAIPAVSGMDERTTLFGFNVVFDPAVPDGEIHMRRATGQMVGRIAGGEVVTRNPV